MAQSRLERIGNIFTRVANLMKGGVLKKEELPIWYAVYEAFPPKYEPKYDRPGSQAPVKDIYYMEDLIRAKFYQDFPSLTLNELSSKKPSRCHQFIKEYRKLEKEGIPTSELYTRTKENFILMLKNSPQMKEENLTKKESIKTVKKGIDVSTLMKEST